MIRVGVIGLGYWGPNLLRNFCQTRSCQAKYGCDLDSNILQKFTFQYPLVTFTDNYEDLLQDPELEAIAIATPTSTHFDLAKLALEHGKHVLVAKPLAQLVEECRLLIKLAEKTKLVLAVDHTFLFSGAVRKIKELIQNHELGDIYYFDSERINLGLIQQDANVIWDLAPHDLSILNYILAERQPIKVFAVGSKHINSKVEEMAHITIWFDGGLVGHIHVSWLSPVKLRKTLIGGSEKMLIYNDLEPHEKVRIYDKGAYLNEVTPFEPAYRSGDVYIPKLDTTEPLKKEIEHFINCIEGKEKPLVGGPAGLAVVEVLAACDRSLRKGKAVDLRDEDHE